MKSLLFSVLAVAVASPMVFAQQNTQTLTGSYVFYEEGSGVTQPIAAIAIINFTSGGSVLGTKYWRSPGNSYKSSLLGTYSTNSDGTMTLSMVGTTLPTDGSDPIICNLNYQLLAPKSSSSTISAIRTDNGYFTIAKLIPTAAAGPLKGSFLFSEHGNGAPYAGLGALTLDGGGNLAGSERVQSIGVNTVYAITGTYSMGTDGFGTFTLNVPSTDLDGNQIVTQTSYIFVRGIDQIYAIRSDANSAFISNIFAQ